MDLGSKFDGTSDLPPPPSSLLRPSLTPDPRWPAKHRWSSPAMGANQNALQSVPISSSSSPAKKVSSADGSSPEVDRQSFHAIVNQSATEALPLPVNKESEPVSSNMLSSHPVETVVGTTTAAVASVSPLLKGAWANKLVFNSSSFSQHEAGGGSFPAPRKSFPESSKEDNLRFPWAARMDPGARNLYRATSPEYMEDGTPKVTIPSNVMSQGAENQKEYVLGQFSRCSPPPGGLIHAVVNRIWGRKCRIFVRKLDDSKFLFHIPDTSTRTWVLQRGLWHVDDCLMFVAPWSTADTFDLPEISTIPVWVTLKNIPNSLYSIPGISHIASGLGAPMATYKPRLDPTLMGEAKILVEVELSKAFPPRIAAADKKGNISMVSVEYAWIPAKCADCGQLGHKASRCMQPRPPIASVNKVASIEVVSPASDSVPTASGLVSPIANHSESPIIDVTSPLETQVITALESEAGPIQVTDSRTMKADCHPNVEAEGQTLATGTVQRGLKTVSSKKSKILNEREVASVLDKNRFSHLGLSFSDGDSLPSDEDSVDSDETDSESRMMDHMTPSGQRLLRERPVQPSVKAKEALESSYAGGRGNRGRGTRGRGNGRGKPEHG